MEKRDGSRMGASEEEEARDKDDVEDSNEGTITSGEYIERNKEDS